MKPFAKFLAALLLLAPAGSAAPQGLADAAAKERERRAQKQKAGKQAPPHVFTNDDLAKGGGAATGTEGAAPAVRSGPGAGTAPAPAGDAQAPASDSESRAAEEASWRSEAADARRTISEAEARLAGLTAEAEQLAGRIRLSTDTNEKLRLADQKTTAEKAVEGARAALEAARAAAAALEERARRAGVPPGWLR